MAKNTIDISDYNAATSYLKSIPLFKDNNI